MKKTTIFIFAVMLSSVFLSGEAFANCGMCGMGDEGLGEGQGTALGAGGSGEKAGVSCFGEVCSLAEEKSGVKEITYEQFQKIKSSGEKYVLLDVLSAESYAEGHIEGAVSFPLGTIDQTTASGKLNKDDKIVVYCGGFTCAASTKSAQKLGELGYANVLDYKGGLEEWQEKGNKLVQ